MQKNPNLIGKSFRLNIPGNDANGVAAKVELVRIELKEVAQHLRETELSVVKARVQTRLKASHVEKVVAPDPFVANDVVVGT